MTDVEQIKERLDVAEVVGSYIQLKPAGRNLKAPCPFHNEKSASFMVSPEKGIWHCFGCSEGGDIFKFVMKYEGIEFRQALEKLARQAGVSLKPRSSEDAKAKKQQEDLLRVMELATQYYHASLAKNRGALEYAVKQRKLTKPTIKDFEIGYAPDDWNALTNFLEKKGISQAQLKQAGLAGQKAGKSTVYDLFRARLMFPICDDQGRTVGFTGRVLAPEQEPKYLNSPQTPLYDKSRVIFGLHLAKPAIREQDEVVIVEGNMDVVSSHQAGVRQVVAMSGTAMTADQLKTLSRLTRNIKLCFDADAAGLKATERAIELSQKLPINLSVVELPSGSDPDDLAQRPAEWKQVIARSKPAMDYLLDRLADEYDLSTAQGKRQYSDHLVTSIRRLADPVEQDHYVKRLADKLDSSPDVIQRKLSQTAKTAPIAPVAEPPRPAATQTVPVAKPAKLLLEESVLALNLCYPELRLSLEDLTPAHFSDPDHQLIVETLQRVGNADLETVAARLPNQADYVKILALRGEEEYGSFAPADRSLEVFELARRLQIASNKDTKTKLSRKLREAQDKGDQQLVHTLLTQYQALLGEHDS
ncbi:DNA primase [Patescibacteria group bacterium]|nr:MAG: DNA primase [Patescibacteria group bacterium]